MIEFLRWLLGAYLPDWSLILLSYLIISVILLLAAAGQMMIAVWVERRGVARFQDRLGPNRVGPLGLFQSVADGVKMFTKEDIVPVAADRWVHLLAPVVTVLPVVLMLAVLPWGLSLVPTDLNVGLLYVLAVASVSGVGLVMAGWGSNNKFSLLGAMRAAAQLISYEIPSVTTLLSVVLLVGSLSLPAIIAAQGGLPLLGNSIAGMPDLGLGWFVFTPVGFFAFAIFYICILAEGERTPFDIPEADSEIVAGYMTEYSGMKFALFFIAQYVLNLILSMLAAIVFLGGWQGPGVAQLAAIPGWGLFAANLLSLVYLLAKTWLIFFSMVSVRGAYPRLRVDQLMNFSWRFLMPLAIVNVISAALWVMITQWSPQQWSGLLDLSGLANWMRVLIAAVVTLVLNAAAFSWLLGLLQRHDEPQLDAEPATS